MDIELVLNTQILAISKTSLTIIDQMAELFCFFAN